MRRTALFVGVVVSMILAGTSAHSGLENAIAEARVIVVKTEPLYVLVLPMAGPYRQHDEAFSRLTVQLRSLGVVPVGPPFGRYFNNPEQVPETDLRWEVGFPVGRDVQVPAPFEVKDIPGGETAILVHEGPYESTRAAWPVLLEWLARRGYHPVGPPMQLYLGDPSRTGSQGPRTELRLPVRRVASSSASPAAEDPSADAVTAIDSR